MRAEGLEPKAVRPPASEAGVVPISSASRAFAMLTGSPGASGALVSSECGWPFPLVEPSGDPGVEPRVAVFATAI
jgi:hypothetical protein